MENLLQCAYFDKYCNACGGTYRVTLYEILQQKRLQKDWQSPRHCAACSADQQLYIVNAMPADPLEKLSAAWEEITRAAGEAKLDIHVGT